MKLIIATWIIAMGWGLPDSGETMAGEKRVAPSEEACLVAMEEIALQAVQSFNGVLVDPKPKWSDKPVGWAMNVRFYSEEMKQRVHLTIMCFRMEDALREDGL